MKTRKRKSIKSSIIAEYWHQRSTGIIGPTSGSMLPCLVEKIRLIDWGEPECFACGVPGLSSKHDRGTRPYECWDNAKALQRCHVVPFFLGGECKPSNMVVLCSFCHKAAPDHKDPAQMERFICSREPVFSELCNGVHAIVGRSGIDNNTMDLFGDNAIREEFISSYRFNISHGCHDRISAVSHMMTSFVEYIKNGVPEDNDDPVSTPPIVPDPPEEHEENTNRYVQMGLFDML